MMNPFSNRRFYRALGALLILVLLLAAVVVVAPASAQELTEQDAIDLAASHPAFVEGLPNVQGWTAAAYDTRSVYGLWRVQFWNAEGETIAKADVSPANRRVYSSETFFPVSDTQRTQAEDALRSFVTSHPEVIELVPDVAERDLYMDYDQWSKIWWVYIDKGMESVTAVVQFHGDTPFTPENPSLYTIAFNALSYEEWYQAQQSLAVSLAFTQPEIAAAVRTVPGWQSSAELLAGGTQSLWVVTFTGGASPLASATVDVLGQNVQAFNVGG